MSLEQRIEKLESLIGVGDEIPPLVVIDIMDCQKGSPDSGTPKFGIVPGKIGGRGITLIRDKDEDPGNFLERCASKHTEFFG